MKRPDLRLAIITVTVLAASAGLAVAAATGASATDGHPVIAGQVNTNTHTTTITASSRNTTPLALNALRSTTPPLTVNTRAKVTNLNADTIDGKDFTSGHTGIIGNADAPAKCPAGTLMTGGGGIAYTGSDPAPLVPQPLSYTGPDTDALGSFRGNAWDAASTNAAATVIVLAMCYNPTGPVPGALPTTSAALTKLVGAKTAPAVVKLFANRHH